MNEEFDRFEEHMANQELKSIVSAQGITGHLLYTDGPTKYVFRVYKDDGGFIDYDLHHSDLEVTIMDPDAFFYRDTFADRLDHSPATLGL